MNHYYDLVDQATHALGGASALLEGDAIVSSTIPQPDGTRTVDQQVAPACGRAENRNRFHRRRYRRRHRSISCTSIRFSTIKTRSSALAGTGRRSRMINDIINHTTLTLLLWGVIAALLALALAIPIVQRLSNTLAPASQKCAAPRRSSASLSSAARSRAITSR